MGIKNIDLGRLTKAAMKGRTASRGSGFGINSGSSRVTEFLGEKPGLLGRAGAMGKQGWSNALNSAGGSKMGLAKGLGGHAVRGAVAGGLIGGTMESMQGGSFWEGAKGGAVNGAVGWTAWRGLGRMTNATTRNPLQAFGKGGVGANAANMWRSTARGNGVSKQAVALLRQKQAANMTARSMNGNRILP